MSLLSTQASKTEDKDSTIAASAHFEGQCSLKNSVGILDSGASDHICCDITLFKHINNKKNTIIIPDGSYVKIKYIGTIKLSNGLKLNKVLYVPDFQYNLISINKLCKEHNAKISFIANVCVMQGPLMKPLLLGKMRNSLYYVEENLTLANANKHTQWARLLSMNTSLFENKESPSFTCLQSGGSNNIEIAKLWHLKTKTYTL